MKCPHCKTEAKTLVKETRLRDGDVVRRRECVDCLGVFGTREAVDESSYAGAGRGRNPNSTSRDWTALTDAWKKKHG